jgi:hypothetical protein
MPTYIGGSPGIRDPLNRHGLAADEQRPIALRCLESIVNYSFGARFRPYNDHRSL